jgi:pimeloyl-ACP methyl ester carboxylesterase
LLFLLALVVAVAFWTWWAEDNPREERQLRVVLHEQLQHWFPEAMTPDNDGWHGLALRLVAGSSKGMRVVLVHGLDEPGSIWHDIIPVLDAAGFEVWEFRYPNDQGIDRSVNYLAERWGDLPADRPAVLIGHSMGGLVIREFVSRWRHPVGMPARIAGAPVRGAILVGTPNQGSEWARLRIWLELREQLLHERDRRFSLFAALRDGTGAAKIDLRPGSDYLNALNALAWPTSVPIRLIGGTLLEPPPAMTESLATIGSEAPSVELKEMLTAWWSGIGENLGDGVVTLTSLSLPQAPPPILVQASHRGLLLRRLLDDPEPPAIAPILRTLDEWSDHQETSRQPGATSNTPSGASRTQSIQNEED